MKLTPVDLKSMTPEQKEYRKQIIQALESAKFNVTEAAKAVKLSRMSMYRRVKMLSIQLPKIHRGRSIFDHKI